MADVEQTAPDDARLEVMEPNGRIPTGIRLVRGFLMGAACPLFLGLYGVYQYEFSPATITPEQPHCGMGSLAAVMFVLVFAPLLGAFGAMIAWAIHRPG